MNLVCEVPIKAIDDFRKMWSEEFTPHPRHVKECAKGKFRAFTYDRIGVCTMCAQFFRVGQQEGVSAVGRARTRETRRPGQKLSTTTWTSALGPRQAARRGPEGPAARDGGGRGRRAGVRVRGGAAGRG